MSQYAKLVWDLHGNKAKASHYFEKAVDAAPSNRLNLSFLLLCHLLATIGFRNKRLDITNLGLIE